MFDDSNEAINNTIYRDFCNGMKNQSKDQLRLAGEIARRSTKGTPNSRHTEILYIAAQNFSQLETQLDNIENNLNKLCALTRQAK